VDVDVDSEADRNVAPSDGPVGDDCPGIDLPPRGPGWTADADERYPLFSRYFTHRYPTVAAACYNIHKDGTITPASYAIILELYELVMSDIQQDLTGKFRTTDLLNLHHLAFEGHLPDQAYRILNNRAPHLLEDNKDIEKEWPSVFTFKCEYSGLHMWDEETLFRANQGRRRTYEYGTLPLPQLTDLAARKVVVLRATPALAQYLIGSTVREYIQGTTQPGIYCSIDDIVEEHILAIDISFYAAYQFFLHCGSKRSLAKKTAMELTNRRSYRKQAYAKFGLTNLTAPSLHTKPRKYGYKQQKNLSKARSAVPSSYTDDQTVVRAKRTDMLKIDRALDPLRVAAHVHDHAVQNMLASARQRILGGVHSIEDLELLYPFKDEELLVRTRVKWP
jgi:hypothetical protein